MVPVPLLGKHPGISAQAKKQMKKKKASHNSTVYVMLQCIVVSLYLQKGRISSLLMRS